MTPERKAAIELGARFRNCERRRLLLTKRLDKIRDTIAEMLDDDDIDMTPDVMRKLERLFYDTDYSESVGEELD